MLFLLSGHGSQITLTCTEPVYVSFSVGIHICISPIMCGRYYLHHWILFHITIFSTIFIGIYHKQTMIPVLPSSQLLCNENNIRNVFCLTEQSSIPFRYWLLIFLIGPLLQQYTMQAAAVLSQVDQIVQNWVVVQIFPQES